MSSPSPYGPDRSLFSAVVVLLGGLLVAAGGVYLLSAMTTDLASWNGRRLVHGGAEPPHRMSAHRRPSLRRGTGVGRTGHTGEVSPGFAGSRVPAWAGSTPGSAVPMRPPSSDGYDLNADLDHAQLGPVPRGGAVHGGTGGSSAPALKPAASTAADLGSSSDGASSAAAPRWRSELSRLGGRLRVLDGALAHLDRSSRGDDAASTSRSNRDGATTATGPQTSSRDVPNPPSVPVDDHLHWLLVAGLLWGTWRVARG